MEIERKWLIEEDNLPDDIKTYAELVQYLRSEKSRIKAKRGRKSAWEQKLLGVTNYKRFSL